MTRYIEISIYRFRYRYIVSYRRKRSTFSIHSDISIYRDIFGIIIGLNTFAFLCQTFKLFSIFVICTFSGNFVQWVTENRVLTEQHYESLKHTFLLSKWSILPCSCLVTVRALTYLQNIDIVSRCRDNCSISYRYCIEFEILTSSHH